MKNKATRHLPEGKTYVVVFQKSNVELAAYGTTVKAILSALTEYAESAGVKNPAWRKIGVKFGPGKQVTFRASYRF